LSSLEQYKGHDQVIEALNILVNQFNINNIEYRIVGKGDDKERLERKVNDLKLNKFVKFYGFVSDEELPKVYAQSNVFIMPSNVSLNPKKPEGEGFGIVFIEAAMYELPMIGPNDGGSTDIIDNNINGLECNPLLPNDIAEKMKIIIENKDLIEKFGKAAKEKILENFTLKQLPKYLEGVINR
jgi:phosphatidylinositol alpha-1,6-mannosyltransferase